MATDAPDAATATGRPVASTQTPAGPAKFAERLVLGLPGRWEGPALAVAIVLFALGTPLIKALVEKGGSSGSVAIHAISYCNVLFVGNVCAAGIVLVGFGPKRCWAGAKRLNFKAGAALLGNTLLASVAAPTLLVTALERTEANVVVLVLPTDVVFMALLGWVFFGEPPGRSKLAGLLLVGCGSLALGVAQDGMFDSAVALTLAAAACRAGGVVTARAALAIDDVLPFFLLARNLLGAIIFYGLAMQMFGPDHFAEAFTPGLWPLMTAYALLVVVLAQWSWYYAIARLPGPTVSQWATALPALALGFSYLLLGKPPSALQWVSVALIVGGRLVMRRGGKNRSGADDADPAEDRHAAEEAAATARSLAAG
ncbi:MAG: DMT family transporter [Planctomycetota bacterium]